MDRYKNILCVGKEKCEWDFSIRATVQELSPIEMDEFRAMIIAAIGTMEDMWRRNQSTGQVVASDGIE